MITPAFTLLAAVLLPVAIDIGTHSPGNFAFDWSGENASGTPGYITTHVEFHYKANPPTEAPDGGHLTVSVPFVAKTGVNLVPITIAVQGIIGGVYDLSVLLVGEGGNRSAHSDPVLAVRVRVNRPAAATNLRVDD